MRNIKPIARRLGSTDGAEIAEAALVLPLLFMFLLGIIWFGRAFNIYGTIAQAAQQGAITAARSTCAECGNTNSDTTVYNTIVALMQASSLDPTKISPNPNPPPVSCVNPPALATCKNINNQVTMCKQALLDSPASPASTTLPPQCGVVISFQYPFQFNVPFTSLNMVTLSAQAQSRMEN